MHLKIEMQLLAMFLGIIVIVHGAAMINCQIAANHFGLEKRYSVTEGCLLRQGGEWRLVKDISVPYR
jgi:hypothetical protein